MLKKTAIAAVAALFATLALSAQPNKNPNNKETPAPNKNTPVILAAPNHQNNGDADTSKPSTNAPTSHTSLKDPDWLLVIVGSVTGLFIGWQSWETRKAAKIAGKALIHQYRPRLKVRRIWADDWDHPTKITVTLANVGGTDAHVLKGSASLRRANWWESKDSLEMVDASIAVHNIVAGQESDGATLSLASVQDLAWAVMGKNASQGQQTTLVCYGEVSYRDDNGVERKMGFDRIYNWNSKSFTPIEKSENEYSD